MSKAIFTVCNIAYLPRALVLARSIYEHERSVLHIYIFDEKRHLPQLPNYAILHWPEDFFGPYDRILAFKYDIVEFTTALKPSITLSLLKDYPSVIFLDPDTRVYSPLDLIWSRLDESSSVLLTPHYLTPQPDTDDESDIPMMRFGSFNLGFFAVTKSAGTSAFLNWWDKRCRSHCYMESQYGLSTDQKWVSIAPCLFCCITILYDNILNVAPWNLFERRITMNNDRFSINGDSELIFFHFSNFDHSDIQYRKCRASNCKTDDWPELELLASAYSVELIAETNNLQSVDPTYSYDYLSSGHYITPLLRRAYASNLQHFADIPDPFNSQQIVTFAKCNFLLAKNNTRYSVRKNLLNTRSQFSTQLKISYLLMRILLRIVGPNIYFDMMRGFVLLSLSRKHPGLWKF
jgi:hypothetical protein